MQTLLGLQPPYNLIAASLPKSQLDLHKMKEKKIN